LGVSRSSIREALSALVALGVLDSRHGAGVFVTSLDAHQLLAGLRLVLDLVEEDRLADLFEVQGTLHASAVALAAARSDVGDRIRLRELADVCREAGTYPRAAEADLRFHAEIGRLSGNATLGALAEAVVPATAVETLWRRLWTKEHDTFHDDHDNLVLAVVSGDPEAARALSTAHTFRTVSVMRRPSRGDIFAPRERTMPPAPVPAVTAGTGRPTPSWYRDAKFGVMVHWGLYSVPGWAPLDESLVELLTDDETHPHAPDETDPFLAHPFAEWYQNGATIEGSPTWHYHRATYGRRAYADFRRSLEVALKSWDPDEWSDLFAAAGARYVIQVAKHHDGYLLWPSRSANPHQQRWSAPRDVVGDVATSVRSRGLRLGIYYSSGIDWTFGHLPITRMVDVPDSMPTGAQYTQYVDDHWRELVDRYQPSVLWNDMGHPNLADARALFRDYYRQVPDGLVTDRFGVDVYDVATPNYARRHVIDPHVWESVRPVGLSFGWNRQEDERHTLTGTQLVHLLLDVVSKNGNLLLGVSPDDRGRIPALQQRGLREVGDWLAAFGEAVYCSRPWVIPESVTQDGLPVRFTVRDGHLYVLLLGQPVGDVILTGVHLDSAAEVLELRRGEDGGPGTPTRLGVRPGRRGSIITLPEADVSHARVVRVSPCPADADLH
jgi:alpha-L-fucosidase